MLVLNRNNYLYVKFAWLKRSFLFHIDPLHKWRLNLNNKHLMTGPLGNSEFCFPRISMFPETKLRETLRFEGN